MIKDELLTYKSSLALFFGTDGLLVNSIAQNPVMTLNDFEKECPLPIESAYFFSPYLIVKCNISSKATLPYPFMLMPIRTLLLQSEESLLPFIIKGAHWANWDSMSRFCGKCASPLDYSVTLPEKHCKQCDSVFFPRLSPAIMVLIQRGNEVLLGRAKHFRPNVYSALAGFIDLGESAEMAVHREVAEEVSLKINHLKYFGSQPWPFPDSLMFAFTANYESGEIIIDDHELDDARWFSLDALPLLPPSISIARKLIESVLFPR